MVNSSPFPLFGGVDCGGGIWRNNENLGRFGGMKEIFNISEYFCNNIDTKDCNSFDLLTGFLLNRGCSCHS